MNDPHSYRQPGSRLPPRDQLVMGIHAVRELLLHAPERLIRVYLETPRGERKSELLLLCEKQGIPISFTPIKVLDQMTGSESHQSIVAHVKGRSFFDVRQFLQKMEQKERALVIMADQLQDPQNFGSLIRCAEGLGADGVVWSKNRGVDITPSVAKASCGACELIPLIRISNLAETVGQFQESGFEALAATLEPSSQNAFQYAFLPKTLLILGSEGEGIQPIIRKRADRSIYIPMNGKVASLNVSAASAVLIPLYCRQYPST